MRMWGAPFSHKFPVTISLIPSEIFNFLGFPRHVFLLLWYVGVGFCPLSLIFFPFLDGVGCFSWFYWRFVMTVYNFYWFSVVRSFLIISMLYTYAEFTEVRWCFFRWFSIFPQFFLHFLSFLQCIFPKSSNFSLVALQKWRFAEFIHFFWIFSNLFGPGKYKRWRGLSLIFRWFSWIFRFLLLLTFKLGIFKFFQLFRTHEIIFKK
jgi:hypothetical protein